MQTMSVQNLRSVKAVWRHVACMEGFEPRKSWEEG